jgi:hypothetical protein
MIWRDESTSPFGLLGTGLNRTRVAKCVNSFRARIQKAALLASPQTDS